MEELTPTSLKSAFKPKNNDSAMLRQLAAELNGNKNTPAPTLPKMTPEEQAANETIMQTELAKAAAIECIPVAAQVDAAKAHQAVPAPAPAEPAAPIEKPARLFVTGHPGAIDRILEAADPASRVVSLSLTALSALKATCELKGNPPPGAILEFRKFGDGEFSPTLQNLLMLGLIRKTHPAFGSPGFWTGLALETATGGDQLIVVGVRTTAEFKMLQESGFKHFHVMATPQTVQRRTPKDYNGTLTQLSQALDSDTHRKISAQRMGQRLNVVWNDDSNPPSGRFILAKDFQESVLGAAPVVVGSDSVSQIL